jgi:hypothetical protein
MLYHRTCLPRPDNREVASDMFVTENTVQTHVQHLFDDTTTKEMHPIEPISA